jgi:AcrR family transcriptional regulator
MTETENTQLDRRTRRTRRLLKEALFSLILEKGYDAVTIEDITEQADLGRTTFYLHYKDKEDLLVESIDSIAAELIARLPPTAWNVIDPRGEDGEWVMDAIRVTFQHAAENAQLYRIILRGEGANQTKRRLQAIIHQKAAELVSERLKDGSLQPRVPMDVFANYFAGALLATITWWLESDTPYPPEEMAEMFRTLFFQGGRNVLGME